MKVLVTGATGVVGRHLVPRLIELGHGVTAVGRSPEKRAALEKLGARAVDLDMFDVDSARRSFEGIDTVVNLATHMPPTTFKTLFRSQWRENDHIRRDGSATLVDAALAAGVQRFIQESFAPIYEDHGDHWIDESWNSRPVSYNRTVLDAENSTKRFTSKGGVGIVLRFAWFYGPDAFLGEMADVVKRGWCPIPGRSDAYWSSLAHEDAASAVLAALGIPAGVYNVCDDVPLTRREVADAFASALDVKSPKLMPPWIRKLGGLVEMMGRSARMSNAKLKAASGWKPKWVSARTGLRPALTMRW